MSLHEEDEPDESLCLCRKFVPAEERIDYMHVATDERTGKTGWKVFMRAHKQCPFHGIHRSEEYA